MKRVRGGAAALGRELLAEQAHEQSAQHQAQDLRPHILNDLRPVQAHTAGNIPQEAGNAEAHVGRVPQGNQHDGYDAHHKARPDDKAMLFDETHWIIPP